MNQFMTAITGNADVFENRMAENHTYTFLAQKFRVEAKPIGRNVEKSLQKYVTNEGAMIR